MMPFCQTIPYRAFRISIFESREPREPPELIFRDKSYEAIILVESSISGNARIHW
jgi:hypothetical protein